MIRCYAFPKNILQFLSKKQITDDPPAFRPESEDPFSSVFSHYLVSNHLIGEEMKMKGTGWLAILILVWGGKSDSSTGIRVFF